MPGLAGPAHPELEQAETHRAEASPLLGLALALEAQGGEGTHLGQWQGPASPDFTLNSQEMLWAKGFQDPKNLRKPLKTHVTHRSIEGSDKS